jgi:hypothetical protein
MATIQGQDWASYQSETPSTKGLSFVFIKATEGTSYVNPKMKKQAAHARAAGLVVGFYHFVRSGDMKKQAAYFVKQADSREGDPLVLDWEDAGVSDAQKNAFLAELKRLRGSSHRVGLYCNTNFWLNKDKSSNCGDFLWIAHYGVGQGKPGIKHDWLIHQYTDDPIDKNVARFESKAAMKAWAEKKPAEPEPEPEKPDPKPEVSEAAKVLAIAKAEVGTKEKKSGGHWVNDSKYNRWFGTIPGYGQGGYGYPWCAVFVAWCAAQAGHAGLYPKTAGCATAVNWFRNKKRFSEYPAIGAQVFFGPGGGTHTGIVYKYDTNSIWTYEGNTNTNGSAEGDGVYARKRGRREVNTYGYGYPAFKEGITTADPSKKGKAGFTYKATASAPANGAPAPKPKTKPWIWFENAQPGKGPNNSVRIVQKALFKEFGKSTWVPSAVFGSKTKALYKQWQQKLGYKGADADGVPGSASMKALAKKHGFDIRYKN